EAMRRVVTAVIRVVVLLMIPATAGAAGRGEGLVRTVFGPAYEGAGQFLALLVGGMFCFTLFSFCGGVLAGADRLPGRFWIVTLLTVQNLCLTLALARNWGASGAAWALLLTALTGLLAIVWPVRQLLGPFIPWATLSRVLLATLCLVALGIWLPSSPAV